MVFSLFSAHFTSLCPCRGCRGVHPSASASEPGLGPQLQGNSAGFPLLSDAGFSTNATLREARGCHRNSMLEAADITQLFR